MNGSDGKVRASDPYGIACLKDGQLHQPVPEVSMFSADEIVD